MNPLETAERVKLARALWTFTEDPGLGLFFFNGYEAFCLRVTSHESKDKDRYVVYFGTEPICMSYGWDVMQNHMTKGEMMTKFSMHDEELREHVRLKCQNDWGHELTDDEISMCIIEMEQQKLSLFHNQIWPNKRTYKVKDDRNRDTGQFASRITWDKTIDGYRAIAHRSGLFCGIDQPEFENNEDGHPVVARITVYRLDRNGNRQAITGEARYEEFVQLVPEWEYDPQSGRNKKTGRKMANSQWAEKPHNQLAVAAERQALRKAFQDCEDAQQGVPANPQPDEPPEKPIEESRGASSPAAFASDNGRAVRAEDVPSAPIGAANEPAKKAEGKPKGKYVGIPRDGFAVYQMYNEGERILMKGHLQDGKGGMRWALALDSGERVDVSEDGYEISRGPRRDDKKGGRDWKEGDAYFDGSTIEKIADSKKGGGKIWLALDNGYKVLLDKWGKEEKKKERKKSKPKDESKPQAPSDGKPAEPAKSAEPAPSESQPAQDVDIETIETVEELRQLTVPLLKKWCDTIHKKRVSMKQAYSELTGVILQKGQAMTLDDFKVLYNCLEEQLNG